MRVCQEVKSVFKWRVLSTEMSVRKLPANVFQARAVPVVRKVKCTNVQRNAKMQNEQAWILLGVISSAPTQSILARLLVREVKRK